MTQILRPSVRSLVAAVFLVPSVLAAGAPASAQSVPVGSIAGTVTFAATGNPVHGATIVVLGARRQATTGEDGKFRIEGVPAGKYDVAAQRQQLRTVQQTVTVTADQTATADFTLVVGTEENLIVTATASGASTTFDAFSSITSLDATAIARKIGPTIADVLQNEPGVAKRTSGPGSSRPIIRGFDGDRVLVMQDGIRTGDLSSQSGDHGVSIDPAGLARIEVVKGPATLLYGSNAIGGVVNAITPQELFRATPFAGTLGGVSFDGGSANAQGGLAMNLQHGTGPWLVFGSFGTRRTGDYDAPDLTIPNSATQLGTGGGGFGWTGRRAYFGASGGLERNRYGIPFAGHHGHDEEDHDDGDELEDEHEALIKLHLKREQFRFDTGLRNIGNRFADAFKVTGGFVNYQHDELEIEDAVETLGTRFTNRIFTLRAEVEQQPGQKVTGRMGIETLTRDYEAVGEESLTPPITQNSFAAFAYEEIATGKHRLLLGGRVEHISYNARYETDPVARSFTPLSGSFGAHFNLGNPAALVVNLTAASRAPAAEELFNFGPHHGNNAFEIGNADLKVERTLGLDASLRVRRGDSRGEINVFTYDIANFVFLDVTDDVEDGLAVSNYTQGDSRFSGVDGSGHFHLGRGVELGLGLSYVRATLTANDEPLPRIPPFQGRIELSFNVGDFSITPELVLSADQNRVYHSESPTAGWSTGNIALTWQRSQAHRTHLIAFQAYNLANRSYRLHTSFLKDLAPEMGRGVKASYTIRFF